jgi:L-alanine-DL-glutamate epimerase-like enolase superfamily enzyme
MNVTVSVLSIPFKYSFSHASADRNRSSSVFVEIKRGRYVGIGEGCPRGYVTGETIEGAIQWIKSIRNSLKNITTITGLKGWELSNESRINKNPSAWCAVETALIDLIGKESGKTVNDLLDIPATTTNQNITAVISDGNIGFVDALLQKCLDFGFTDFKIKFSGNIQKDLEKTVLLNDNLSDDHSVRVDFNNAFSSKEIDAFIEYLDALNYNFAAIEEPFEPYAFSAMRKIIELYKVPMVLDESFMLIRDFDRLDQHDNFIPNIRISKLGGLLRTLSSVEIANRNQIPIILGSLVGETSILSRLWIVVAGHYGPNIYAAEGAYSTHLLEADITEFPIIVEPPGVINVPETIMKSPGLGIEILPEIRKYLTVI